MSDIPTPTPFVAVRLASIARHVAEALGPDGHAFDSIAIESLLSDPDVLDYMATLDRLALLPVLR